jgi:plasmid stabilization system protein ParE
MPEGATPKQKRQYEHIKESYQERGVSADEAKERAARTVNKERGKKKSKKKI